MPSRAIYVVPWGARLHHADKYYSGLKVPKQYLNDNNSLDKVAHAQWRQSFIRDLNRQCYWQGTISSWMTFCIGLEASLEDAVPVFVDVLWCRFQGRDEDAINILNEVQDELLQRPIPSPPKLNPFVCEEDSDVDSAPSDSDSNSDSYGSSDTEEISGSDESYHPGSSVSSNSDDGSTMEVDPVVQPDEDDLMVLNARNSRRWCDHWLSTSEGKMAAITRWNHSLRDYHFCTEPQEVSDAGFGARQEAAVMALREMKAVHKKIYNNNSWRRKVKSSGLAKTIAEICEPGSFGEWDCPLVVEMYHRYCWRDTLGMVLNSWTNEDVRDTFPKDWPRLTGPFEHVDAVWFILYLSADEFLIPSIAHPSTVFFLLSLANFLEAWSVWLMAALKHRNMPADKWDPEQLYRDIMAINFQHSDKLCLASTSPVTRIAGCTPLNPRLSCIIEETFKVRASGQKMREMSSNQLQPCTNCADKPESEKCVRTWNVENQPNAESLIGSIITCAEKDDVLKSKPPSRKSKSKKEMPPDPVVHSPDSLGLKPIKHRPNVFKACGRDINILNEQKTGANVGGVQFKPPACNNRVWGTMRQHHDQASKSKAVRRGSTIEVFGYGSMHGFGSRQPQGGREGDTYTEYPELSATTVDDIKDIFCYAYDSDGMDAMISAVSPSVYQELKQISADAETNRLGSTGTNLYYCKDYMSSQHRDNDASWSLCIQLTKQGLPDEYNFSFTQWGVYIVTEPRCIWWFNANHVHGTIMPRQSSLDAPISNYVAHAVSSGTHKTVRKKDAKKALERKQARVSYQARTDHWAADDDVEMTEAD